jgi:hypothetical protein
MQAPKSLRLKAHLALSSLVELLGVTTMREVAMTQNELELPIYSRGNASTTEFVKFWSRQWSDKDRKSDEDYYKPHLKGALTDEGLRDLFRWKNQTPLSAAKQRTLERIVARREELVDLSRDTKPEDFLNRFREGQAIWWIFLLHCWSHRHGSKKYPIYDQHVHRAMTFICKGEREESGGWSNKAKVNAYLTKYLRFFDRFGDHDPKKVDQALMVFGRFVKTYHF